MKFLIFLIQWAVMIGLLQAEDRELIRLWPDDVPGEEKPKAPPVISDQRRGNVTRLAQVTDPALVVFEANPATKKNVALIICPGGAYNILAIDKEGYEAGEWLSQLGYTAFVLQYRVPKNPEGALQDAQRAIRCVRGMQHKWGIKKIGFMGFSAGGSLSARLTSRYAEELYEPVDEHDRLSARPDFLALIYAAYLDQGKKNTLTPELKINKGWPPVFLFVSANDRHANSSLVMGSSLREKKVPFELHIFPKGGHGYGLRSGLRAAEEWPKLCQAWMEVAVLK